MSASINIPATEELTAQLAAKQRTSSIWPDRVSSLNAFFAPRSIVLFGATERAESVGRTLLENLAAYPGPIYAVNPGHETVLGRPCHPTLASLPEVPDLAVIAVPAARVAEAVQQCADRGIRAAIILSAGFRETGTAGLVAEAAISRAAGRRIRLLGPNCIGLIRPGQSLNASFCAAVPHAGRVAFLSQSGALCSAIADWSATERIGFSALVSVGSMLDVNWADLIEYFGADENTQSIVCYMESIGDARRFQEAAQKVAARKPIIVLKTGCTEAGAKAAASHTGAMACSDDVISAVFESCGVLRVDSVAELFSTAKALAKQPLPRGPRIAVLTNAGGPGALAIDAAVSKGSRPADLSAKTIASLDQFLPPFWSKANPVDLLGTATAADYQMAAALLLEDPEVDGLIAILTPQSVTTPGETAEAIVAVATGSEKPVYASWMGGEAVREGCEFFENRGVPTFDHPDAAARVFALLWKQRGLSGATNREEDSVVPHSPEVQSQISALLKKAREEGRVLLTEIEANTILELSGIPMLTTIAAHAEHEAVTAAQKLGFPVALKLLSTVITHKRAAGGVKLQLCNEAEVREAWAAISESATRVGGCDAFGGVAVQPMATEIAAELIIGTTRDAVLGPVVLAGVIGCTFMWAPTPRR